jgi:hypothetical protein
MEPPITEGALATFAGALFIALVAGLWTKKFLPDWRLTPLAVLGVTVVLTVLANAVFVVDITEQRLWLSAFWGLFAATLETFGYEVVVNGLGMMGVGHRSDDALDTQAVTRVAERGLDESQAET